MIAGTGKLGEDREPGGRADRVHDDQHRVGRIVPADMLGLQHDRIVDRAVDVLADLLLAVNYEERRAGIFYRLGHGRSFWGQTLRLPPNWLRRAGLEILPVTLRGKASTMISLFGCL